MVSADLIQNTSAETYGFYYSFWLLIHLTNVCWTPGIILRAGDTVMTKKALVKLILVGERVGFRSGQFMEIHRQKFRFDPASSGTIWDAL